MALASVVVPVAGQELPTIAVADFDGIFVSDGQPLPIGPTVTDMLITEFSQMDGIEVLERSELSALLDEQDLSLSGRMNDASVIEVGRLLGVQYFFFGQASSIADMLRLDVRAVDVETSQTVASLSRTGAPTSALFTEVVTFADEFASTLDLVAPADRPQAEDIPVLAVIAYSRGLDFEDRGEIDSAIEQYEGALAAYPGYRAAERALERLRGG